MRRRPPGLGKHADASHKSAWPQRHVPPICTQVVEDYKLEEDKPVGVYGQPEWAISGSISKTLVDNLLSVGIEGKWTKPDEEA